MFANSIQRRLAVTAAVLAALSAVVAVNATRTRPSYRTVLAAATPVAAVDATGCPATARCLVVQRATGLDAAVTKAFPAGRILSVQSTLDLGDQRTYRSTLLGLIQGTATVRLSAQCVPGAPPSLPRLDRFNTAYVDLGGNSLINSRELSILVPGAPGCSLALLLRTPGSSSRYQGAAIRLAHSPAAQLQP